MVEDVADFGANQAESLEVERGKPDLHGPRVVEAGLRLEIDVEPLGQGLQPLNALGAIIEGRSPVTRR